MLTDRYNVKEKKKKRKKKINEDFLTFVNLLYAMAATSSFSRSIGC